MSRNGTHKSPSSSLQTSTHGNLEEHGRSYTHRVEWSCSEFHETRKRALAMKATPPRYPPIAVAAASQTENVEPRVRNVFQRPRPAKKSTRQPFRTLSTVLRDYADADQQARTNEATVFNNDQTNRENVALRSNTDAVSTPGGHSGAHLTAVLEIAEPSPGPPVLAISHAMTDTHADIDTALGIEHITSSLSSIPASIRASPHTAVDASPEGEGDSFDAQQEDSMDLDAPDIQSSLPQSSPLDSKRPRPAISPLRPVYRKAQFTTAPVAKSKSHTQIPAEHSEADTELSTDHFAGDPVHLFDEGVEPDETISHNRNAIHERYDEVEAAALGQDTSCIHENVNDSGGVRPAGNGGESSNKHQEDSTRTVTIVSGIESEGEEDSNDSDDIPIIYSTRARAASHASHCSTPTQTPPSSLFSEDVVTQPASQQIWERLTSYVRAQSASRAPSLEISESHTPPHEAQIPSRYSQLSPVERTQTPPGDIEKTQLIPSEEQQRRPPKRALPSRPAVPDIVVRDQSQVPSSLHIPPSDSSHPTSSTPVEIEKTQAALSEEHQQVLRRASPHRPTANDSPWVDQSANPRDPVLSSLSHPTPSIPVPTEPAIRPSAPTSTYRSKKILGTSSALYGTQGEDPALRRPFHLTIKDPNLTKEALVYQSGRVSASAAPSASMVPACVLEREELGIYRIPESTSRTQAKGKARDL